MVVVERDIFTLVGLIPLCIQVERKRQKYCHHIDG